MGKVTVPKASPTKMQAMSASPRGKVPKASDLLDAKVGNKREQTVRDDKVHIYQLPFCDDGSVYGAKFSGPMVALHLLHDYPNVWFLFLQALGRFCEARHDEDKTFPSTWQDLCESMTLKIGTTSPGRGQSKVDDEDDVGTFVKHRLVIYCDLAAVKNVCCLLDGFVAWRAVTPLRDNEPPFENIPDIVIHVPATDDLAFAATDDLECTVSILKDLPTTSISPVQAYPPAWPPRFVLATITSESESTLSVVFSGNTRPFAIGFDEQGIGKKQLKTDGSLFPEWFRVCRGVDLSDPSLKTWLLQVFGPLVLKSSPCFLRIETWPQKDEAFNAFVKELQAMRSIYS
jgi:hypothetical protein